MLVLLLYPEVFCLVLSSRIKAQQFSTFNGTGHRIEECGISKLSYYIVFLSEMCDTLFISIPQKATSADPSALCSVYMTLSVVNTNSLSLIMLWILPRQQFDFLYNL